MIKCTYKWPRGDISTLHSVLNSIGCGHFMYKHIGTRPNTSDAYFHIVYELDISSEDYLVLKLKDPNFINYTSHDNM